MSKNTDADYSLPWGVPKEKTQQEPSEEQQSILDALNNGWTLWQSRQTFKWYMKRTDITPFRTLFGTLYKPACVSLLSKGFLTRINPFEAKHDIQYILKEVKGVSNGN